jgi:pyruvate formate lyase activating enzyme
MPLKVALRRTSLIDFPGRVAAVAFVQGCNFRCPYCQNAALVDGSSGFGAADGAGAAGGASGDGEFVSIEDVEAFLDRRRRLISGLVISGGEPLLHEETPRLAAAARERGLAVKLDTNGYFPDRMEAVAADYVAIDFKTSPSAYARVAPGFPDAGERVLESLGRVRSSGREFEVRITCAPGVVGSAEIEEMLRFLEPDDTVMLQPFRPGGCLDEEWDRRLPYTDAQMREMLGLLRGRVSKAKIRMGS